MKEENLKENVNLFKWDKGHAQYMTDWQQSVAIHLELKSHLKK